MDKLLEAADTVTVHPKPRQGRGGGSGGGGEAPSGFAGFQTGASAGNTSALRQHGQRADSARPLQYTTNCTSHHHTTNFLPIKQNTAGQMEASPKLQLHSQRTRNKAANSKQTTTRRYYLPQTSLPPPARQCLGPVPVWRLSRQHLSPGQHGQGPTTTHSSTQRAASAVMGRNLHSVAVLLMYCLGCTAARVCSAARVCATARVCTAAW